MPDTYTFRIKKDIKEFQYDGITYKKQGDQSPELTACKAKKFYAAYKAANPDQGVNASQQTMDQLEKECPPTPANVEPQPATAFSPPLETNPSNVGGDSATHQAAPAPPVSGDISHQQDGGSNSTVPQPSDEPTRPPDGEAHPTHGGEQPQVQTSAGDPVDIFNGAFYLQETDLEIPNTILPFSFTRMYRSGAAAYGPFGWNWDHNFNLYIRELNNGNIALWRNLHENIFKYDGANFEPPRGLFEKLERIPAIPQIYEIKAKGGITMRFERPAGWVDGERIPLLWISDQHGNLLNFSYGAEDKLAEVIDDDDRYFRFDYDNCGLLVAVYDNTGRKFQYQHDEQTMQLVCVKSPGITDHPDGIIRIYHYEQPWSLPELRHNIVRVEDSNGNVYVENTYDQDPASWSYARVIEQLYGGFLYQFLYTQLQWVPANAVYINIPAVRVEVMNPDYGLETYTFNYRGDLLDRRYRLSRDNSYRVVAWLYDFDEQGNQSKTTHPDGAEEINVFDFSNTDPKMRGNLLQKEITAASGFPSPSRIIWKGKYDPSYQQLTEEKNESGQVTQYKYDFEITPAAITNTGKLIEIRQPNATLPDGTIQSATVTFEYNSKGQLTANILADGTRNENHYGLAGVEKSRLVKKVFDVGNLTIQQIIRYDSFGFASEKTDGNGNTFKQVYNALGLIENIILPTVNGLSAEFILHYDSDKKVIATEKPKGTFVDSILTDNFIIDKFERDVLGYPIKYILSSNTSESRILKICNDYRGFPIETINPDGSKIQKSFDERGLPLTEGIVGTDGKNIISKKVYDRAGKLTQETNPFGLTTKYEYDGFSRISKVILPNSTEINKKWLKNNLLESEETIGDDGTGTIRQLTFKSYTYDEKNRRVTETVKVFTDNQAVFSNTISTIIYDKLDRPTQIINNRGGITSRVFDGLGRVISETDPEGNKQQYLYDNNGNILQTDSHHLEPDGTVSIITKKFKYDERNREIEIVEPDGSRITSLYDDRDLLVKQTDHSGVIKETFFNSFNNKIQEIEDVGGLNIKHEWALDTLSRIVAYLDPTGQVSRYSYDSVGRNFKIDYPNGFFSIKVFNDTHLVIKEQLGSGVEFSYTYDSGNRISAIENTKCPPSLINVDIHQFSYDGLDRVLNARVGSDIIVRKYDSLGRLSAETTLGNTISCNYDDATGDVEKIWPDGRTEKLSHNLNGVLTSIDETAHGTLGSGTATIAAFKTSGPNAFGRADYSGGININNTYDERKRLTEINVFSPSGTNENIKYRYNVSGFKQVEALLGQNPKISYFEFDNKHRISICKDHFSVVIPNANTQIQHDAAINAVKLAAMLAQHSEEFLYDASDARTKYAETGLPDKNYTYASGHKILNDGVNSYSHNTDGTLESDGTFNYEADALGRIVSIKSGVNTITKISYDAFGRPNTVSEVGQPKRTYHYLGGFVEQIDENGISARQITLHPLTGVPIAYHTTLGTHYTVFDSRINLIGLLDTTGNLVEIYRYQSFGQPKTFNNAGVLLPASAFGIEPIFGGQRYLMTCGLYLAKRRLMNPMNGLFLSSDPRGYIDSSSLYIYAVQNPIDYIDPEGEFAFLAILAVMAVGALISGGLNAARQGIAISEGSQEGWEWGQFGKSVGIGAIAAPVLVVAPELAVPLAGWGVAGGIGAISEGNYATGTFDIVTSLAPFGFKGPRNATIGAGTRFGQTRGLGESASWGTRTGRFTEIGNSISASAENAYNKRFYRGTTYYEALDAEQSGLNLENVFARQRSASAPPRLGVGLYLTEALEPPAQGSAPYWADVHGGSGRGGGPAVLEASIPRLRWLWLRGQKGVESGIPQPNFPLLPSTVETYVPENGGMANYFNRNSSWRIAPDSPALLNYDLLLPTMFTPTYRSSNSKK